MRWLVMAIVLLLSHLVTAGYFFRLGGEAAIAQVTNFELSEWDKGTVEIGKPLPCTQYIFQGEDNIYVLNGVWGEPICPERITTVVATTDYAKHGDSSCFMTVNTVRLGVKVFPPSDPNVPSWVPKRRSCADDVRVFESLFQRFITPGGGNRQYLTRP